LHCKRYRRAYARFCLRGDKDPYDIPGTLLHLDLCPGLGVHFFIEPWVDVLYTPSALDSESYMVNNYQPTSTPSNTAYSPRLMLRLGSLNKLLLPSIEPGPTITVRVKSGQTSYTSLGLEEIILHVNGYTSAQNKQPTRI
jgi:hypothetical protein